MSGFDLTPEVTLYADVIEEEVTKAGFVLRHPRRVVGYGDASKSKIPDVWCVLIARHKTSMPPIAYVSAAPDDLRSESVIRELAKAGAAGAIALLRAHEDGKAIDRAMSQPSGYGPQYPLGHAAVFG